MVQANHQINHQDKTITLTDHFILMIACNVLLHCLQAMKVMDVSKATLITNMAEISQGVSILF